MRRGVGLGAIQNRQKEKAAAEVVGSVLSAERVKHVEDQLSSFKSHLEDFARKHRAEINKDPEFRRSFAKMTRSIGVDPLASGKGFWSEALGVGTFYFELGVQIVDACLATRITNGGLISLAELTARVTKMRGGGGAAAARADASRQVSADDVRRAVEAMTELGGGYRVLSLGAEPYLLSVPVEMNVDQTLVLQRVSAQAAAAPVPLTAFDCAHITPFALQSALGWDAARVGRCLAALVREGLAWLDAQAPEVASEGPRYYFPGIVGSGGGRTAVAGAGHA